MKKILIVDDSPASVKVIAGIIDKSVSDCRIFQTIDSEAAFRIALKEIPDLIISDWEMPGMTGIDLINFLRSDELTERIPVIIVTGVMVTDENLSKAMDVGAVDFIRKPVIELELQARVNATFRLLDLFERDKEQQKIILEQEKALIEEKTRQLSIDLEKKKKTLASTTIQLVQNSELNNKLIAELKELKNDVPSEYKSKISTLIRSYQTTFVKQSWSQFEEQFSEVHQEFEASLNNRFPNLTPNDKRLCTFLRLNMTTKDIAAITYADTNSINVARTRLRKKLGIRREENLITFLSNV